MMSGRIFPASIYLSVLYTVYGATVIDVDIYIDGANSRVANAPPLLLLLLIYRIVVYNVRKSRQSLHIAYALS